MTKIAVMPVYSMVKTLKNLPQNKWTDGFETFGTIGYSSTTKIVQILTLAWVDLDFFYGKFKYGKMI